MAAAVISPNALLSNVELGILATGEVYLSGAKDGHEFFIALPREHARQLAQSILNLIADTEKEELPN